MIEGSAEEGPGSPPRDGRAAEPPARDGRRRAWLIELAIVAWYLLLTCLFLWPLVTGLDRVVVHSIRDPGLQATVVNNVTRHLLAGDLAHLFDGSFFYPAHLTLALSDLQLGVQPLALPLWLIDNDALLIGNLLSVLTFPLAAIAADRLARTVGGGSRVAGWVSGTVFAFAAYRIEHLIHLAMLGSWILPVAFIGLEWTLRDRGWRGPVLWGAAMVVAAGLALHYFLILAVVQPIYLVVRVLLTRDRRAAARRCLRFVAPALVAAVPVGLLVLPYVTLASQGFTRSLSDTYAFSARLQDYLVPAADSVVAHPLFDALRPLTGIDERELSPGLVALGLAFGGIAAALILRRRRWLAIAAPWIVIGLVALVLSLGPRLLPNAPVESNGSAYPPLPYLLLTKLTPVLGSLRTPARFGVIVLLAVAIVAGLSLAAAVRRLRTRPRAQAVLIGAVGLLLALEYSVAPVTASVAWGSSLPASVRWLAAAPAGPVVELPTALPYPSVYALRSTVDGHPRLNGWSGFTPKVSALINRPDIAPSGLPRWLDEGARLGARYLVVHDAALDPAMRTAIEAAVQARGMRLAGSFGSDRIYLFGP